MHPSGHIQDEIVAIEIGGGAVRCTFNDHIHTWQGFASSFFRYPPGDFTGDTSIKPGNGEKEKEDHQKQFPDSHSFSPFIIFIWD